MNGRSGNYRIGRANNMSAFITEGVRQYLARLKAERALEESAGAWTVADHPELENFEEIADYVRGVRTGWRRENEICSQ